MMPPEYDFKKIYDEYYPIIFQLSTVSGDQYFISELLGFSLGVGNQRSWWKKHFVDPKPVLARAGA